MPPYRSSSPPPFSPSLSFKVSFDLCLPENQVQRVLEEPISVQLIVVGIIG